MAKIRFLPSGKVETCHVGQSVFEAGWKSDVGIQSACVGKGTCGLCRVIIVDGEAALSPYNKVEEKHLGNLYYLTKLRLSCQAIVTDDDAEIVVEVKPKKSKRKKPGPKK